MAKRQKQRKECDLIVLIYQKTNGTKKVLNSLLRKASVRLGSYLVVLIWGDVYPSEKQEIPQSLSMLVKGFRK